MEYEGMMLGGEPTCRPTKWQTQTTNVQLQNTGLNQRGSTLLALLELVKSSENATRKLPEQGSLGQAGQTQKRISHARAVQAWAKRLPSFRVNGLEIGNRMDCAKAENSLSESNFKRIKSLGIIAAIPFFLSGCSLSGAQPVGFQDQIKVGEQFIQAGQYESGYAILDGISENQNTLPHAQIAVGDTYLRANALLRAESAYAKAAKLGEQHLSEIGLGRVALKRNRADIAQRHLRNALAQDDQSVAAWNGLGVAYDLERNHSEAQRSYRRAIAIQPDAYEAINNLGLSLILGGNSASAVETLTTLSASRLDNDTTRMNLSIALHIAGFSDQAAQLAESKISASDAQQIFTAVISYLRRSA